MKFDPKSADTLIPVGEYDGEIAAAEEKTSKAGKDMWKLTVKVWPGDGGPRTVFDYIVNPDTLYKLRHIADATGKREIFDSGEMEPKDVIGESVRVAIKVEKDKSGNFPDKNVIARYLSPAAGVVRNGTSAGGDVADDDMPF